MSDGHWHNSTSPTTLSTARAPEPRSARAMGLSRVQINALLQRMTPRQLQRTCEAILLILDSVDAAEILAPEEAQRAINRALQRKGEELDAIEMERRYALRDVAGLEEEENVLDFLTVHTTGAGRPRTQ